jgi:hypothetical protein
LALYLLKTFKMSNDLGVAEKVFDAVGRYLKWPDNTIVLSTDKKTQIQALNRTQRKLQLMLGQIEHRTHDYRRCGVTISQWAAFNMLSGEVIGRITQRHQTNKFLNFSRHIGQETPSEQDLPQALDHGSTHEAPGANAWLRKHL